MYGSDDIPVGVLRGKYIAFGFAWAYLSPSNHSLNLSHCDGRMTFTRYEQLRAMRRAARRLGMHAGPEPGPVPRHGHGPHPPVRSPAIRSDPVSGNDLQGTANGSP